ncbi:MAG: hypothetical protein H6974_01625 [Gammaproteobacteria bacterium]|nr:hypothetical protein [Gammaproteobacteria bacterium]MCP5195486.1 hypothetical protein [Gammaproteobacteria bacterium]
MQTKNPLSLLAAVLAFTSVLLTQPAIADAKTDAVIGRLGSACKTRVMEQFDVPNSDINVRLGATLQEQLDSGAMTGGDLKKNGASFDWSVSGKSAKGYCNVNGHGKIEEFKQW